MTFTKDLLPDERLVKILSETQETINEHNRRQVRGSVEVDARLLESMLAEIQLRRHLMEKAALAGVEADQGRNPVLAYADSYRDMAKQGVESIPAWSVITDLERNIAPHIIAPQPLTTSERAELENYRNAQQVVPSDGRDQFEEWFKFHHGDEHSIAMLQRANGGANYIDPYVDLAWISWKDSRAAMLQGKAEPVTTACKLPVSTTCKEAPEHIWLQTAGIWPENGEFSELTWCSDNQHQDDTLYVRADVVTGNSPVTPDGWIPVSERMPGRSGVYMVWNGKHIGAVSLFFGSFQCIKPEQITHWRHMPAAPQEEKTERKK